MRKEKEFNAEVKNSIKAVVGANIWERGYGHKLPDPPRGGFGKDRTFTTKRPCDIFYFYDGHGGAIESKFQRNFSAFGANKIALHQIDTLNYIYNTNNKAFVFLNIFIPREENRLLVFPWNECGWRLTVGPSYKKKELLEWPYVQGHKKLYDLTEIL